MAIFDDEEDILEDAPKIHLRLQMRTVRKSITIVEGLKPEDAKVILKDLRKRIHTNGTVTKSKEGEPVLTVQGDKRKIIKQYLIDEKYAKSDTIITHGF
jgi:translation initiation factor SUI1